ncbi:NAD(P)/FAD-dependent oxidoreductase [Aliiroseovarius subalbicans]|uniref:NAD(P)/FAD-dependent oxidoreductase n=1 Tax=Aliiroseovarius subalbicans TaxID=2925840 RepID=UPI001F5A6B73|nr:NAD(P)/FAD-dependent oxidoreductase [Aliiroseovarius subalbicans]MCI2398757.1 NAD(P)/FAD-dependent oxidoreductase [Aliiroseovarius subalbicans]
MRYDTIIIGAGAAGLFCGAEAARSGKSTLVLDHAKKPGEKIRISGGGRCNFTNMFAGPENFLSQNKHFAKSALKRFTQWDFIDRVDRAGIAWHEKTLGQLFCDDKATQIIDMLLDDLKSTGGELRLDTSVQSIAQDDDGFTLTLPTGRVRCANLVIATGGKSIPKMGATGLAYDIARQFGHALTETRPGLVPLTFPEGRFAALSGLSLPVRISNARATFDEAMLFTHRGLSGPAILQISSYWREGEPIEVNLIPDLPLFDLLAAQRQLEGRRNLTTELARHLPARLVDHLSNPLGLTGNLADQSDTRLRSLEHALSHWQLIPNGSEGYRTAEVTLGGIDTDGLDSRTMMSKTTPGLYFIGECVDVTGWLGGYNFQWAWASAHAAGNHIAAS